MKKFSVLGITIILLLSMAAPFVLKVSAVEIQNKNNEDRSYTVDEEVNDDLYVSADERVVVQENVNGDLFVGSGEVIVEGDVDGDVYAAGGLLDIKGNVTGTVITAGGQVDVNGNVGRSVIVAGGNVNVGGKITEDVLAAGGTVVLDGPISDDVRAFGGLLRVNGNVEGDVVAFGGSVDVSGDVGGDVHVAGDDVRIRSSIIGGDLVSYDTKVDVGSGVEIQGERIEESVPQKAVTDIGDTTAAVWGGFSLMFKIVIFFLTTIGFILLGLLLEKLAPVKLEGIVKEMYGMKESLVSFGVGLVSFLVFIVLAILLAISVIGWPILVFLIGLAVLAKSVVVPVVGLCIGRFLLRLTTDKPKNWLSMIIGIVILQLFLVIPCIGTLLNLLVTATAIGAMIMMKYNMLWGKEK